MGEMKVHHGFVRRAGVAVTLLVMLAAIGDPAGSGSMHAAPATAIRSVTVYENAQVRGSLAEPTPFSRLHIQVKGQDAHIELVGQLLPTQERILVVSGLNNQIITALTPAGVVGRSLDGGYELPTIQQEALLRLSGVLPQGEKNALVATLISESPEGVKLLTEVTASVKSGELIPPMLKRLWPFLLLGLVLVGAVVYLLKRRRQSPAWE